MDYETKSRFRKLERQNIKILIKQNQILKFLEMMRASDESDKKSITEKYDRKNQALSYGYTSEYNLEDDDDYLLDDEQIISNNDQIKTKKYLEMYENLASAYLNNDYKDDDIENSIKRFGFDGNEDDKYYFVKFLVSDPIKYKNIKELINIKSSDSFNNHGEHTNYEAQYEKYSSILNDKSFDGLNNSNIKEILEQN